MIEMMDINKKKAMKVIVEFELDETWDKEYADCSDEIIVLDLEAGGFTTGVKSASLVKVERKKKVIFNNQHDVLNFTFGKEYEATPSFIKGFVSIIDDNGAEQLFREGSDAFLWK